MRFFSIALFVLGLIGNASGECTIECLQDGCVDEADVNNCPADLNEDGAVTTADLLLFLSAFGENCE